jgi:hypothetical protein
LKETKNCGFLKKKLLVNIENRMNYLKKGLRLQLEGSQYERKQSLKVPASNPGSVVVTMCFESDWEERSKGQEKKKNDWQNSSSINSGDILSQSFRYPNKNSYKNSNKCSNKNTNIFPNIFANPFSIFVFARL